MAHRSRREATDTLEELASLGDRLVQWVSEHAVLSIAIAASILLGAAATGGYLSYSARQSEKASAVFEALRDEFVVAMGGTPGNPEIPEPANPETAHALRLEFAERYLSTAAAYEGSAAATLARLEAGDLLARAGEKEPALEIWEQALRHARHSTLRAVLLTRIATAHESAERFAEAAQAHEQAAEIESFPLRHLALARAAWAWAEAGEPDRALALYRRLQGVAPDALLPPHLDARLRELEAAYGG